MGELLGTALTSPVFFLSHTFSSIPCICPCSNIKATVNSVSALSAVLGGFQCILARSLHEPSFTANRKHLL